MKSERTRQVIGLAEAAQRLGLPYQDAHRLVLTGDLHGEKRGSRWYVPVVDVTRLARERRIEPLAAG
jgi:hypothetical protein